MTRDELRVRVEHWRQRLLPEWRVVLFDEPPPWAKDEDRGYLAICQTAEDYTEARLYFTDQALDREDARVEVTIVHELLHALLRELGEVHYRVQLHPAESSGVRRAFYSAEERAVDRLSRALVELDRGECEVGPLTSLGLSDRTEPDTVDIVDHQ